MIPHSRKDTSGRTQLSKAELELIFKLYQKGGKEGGRGRRGQKWEGRRTEAKKELERLLKNTMYIN